MQNHENVFHISDTDNISFILYDGTEIPLSKYNKSLYPAFLKISNDNLRKTDNEIFIFCESTHFIITDIAWQDDKGIDI